VPSWQIAPWAHVAAHAPQLRGSSVIDVSQPSLLLEQLA
jgi:hypothetical protein